MSSTQSQTAMRAVRPGCPPPFVIDSAPRFDPFEPGARQSALAEETTAESSRLVHIASLGLLVLLGVVAAPWWAFGLLACAWLSAIWVS